MTYKLITFDELAAKLGNPGRASIYRYIKNVEGFPQPVKVGSLTRFVDSQADDYIAGLCGDDATGDDNTSETA